jgi:hypothetical protein
MEAISSSEMSGCLQNTQRYNSEDAILRNHLRDDLKLKWRVISPAGAVAFTAENFTSILPHAWTALIVIPGRRTPRYSDHQELCCLCQQILIQYFRATYRIS